jgi:hypothetical protein
MVLGMDEHGGVRVGGASAMTPLRPQGPPAEPRGAIVRAPQGRAKAEALLRAFLGRVGPHRLVDLACECEACLEYRAGVLREGVK